MFLFTADLIFFSSAFILYSFFPLHFPYYYLFPSSTCPYLLFSSFPHLFSPFSIYLYTPNFVFFLFCFYSHLIISLSFPFAADLSLPVSPYLLFSLSPARVVINCRYCHPFPSLATAYAFVRRHYSRCSFSVSSCTCFIPFPAISFSLLYLFIFFSRSSWSYRAPRCAFPYLF